MQRNEELTISATYFVGGVSAIDATVATLRQIDARAIGATEVAIRSASFMTITITPHD